MSDQLTLTLNNGVAMPQLGFGVWQVPDEQTTAAVSAAFEVGYRAIDTAAMYRNERGVGQAIARSGLPREDLFITTKLNNGDHGAQAALKAFERSRTSLGLEYLDLYLIHWPLPAQDRYVETWQAFERLLDDGAVRAIGVSNFHQNHLQRLADASEIVPAVNQIELHPYLTQPSLREYDATRGIATEAWSPLASGGGVLRDRVITSLADKYRKTTAQVILRWHLQLGNLVIPKSVTPARIRENFEVFDFDLDVDDVAAISDLNRDERTGPDPDSFNP
ncbi:MAG: aldo/keto reductase [Jatrophihabitantaceae bacterium]